MLCQQGSTPAKNIYLELADANPSRGDSAGVLLEIRIDLGSRRKIPFPEGWCERLCLASSISNSALVGFPPKPWSLPLH